MYVGLWKLLADGGCGNKERLFLAIAANVLSFMYLSPIIILLFQKRYSFSDKIFIEHEPILILFLRKGFFSHTQSQILKILTYILALPQCVFYNLF